MFKNDKLSVFHQFHKGTIKTVVSPDNQESCKIHFNSIKVQLRRELLWHFRNNVLFQFHKGTIKTPIVSSYLFLNSISIP